MKSGKIAGDCPNVMVHTLGWSTIEGNESHVLSLVEFVSSILRVAAGKYRYQSLAIERLFLILPGRKLVELTNTAAYVSTIARFLRLYVACRSRKYWGEVSGFMNRIAEAMEKLQ
ncbi:hypothetical protein INT43_006691 [Umbelopsis isabellina]|uniref:Uncharacterized protein n=1 Tax=Mortierella isabellina TaxID=91625 RepID=A0A8H7UL09_MORIS|nr:hypothetical protein INT43_006691 [Umbelopsis isabellina]